MLTLLIVSFLIILILALTYKSHYSRLKNTLKETIVAQVVMCLIYILIFFIGSAIAATLGDAWGNMVLIIMTIIPIKLTKYYMKTDKQETEKVKRFIFTSIIWIIENTILGLLNIEIIEGWEALGNAIMIGWIAIAPIVLVLICKVISYIYHKIKG